MKHLNFAALFGGLLLSSSTIAQVSFSNNTALFTTQATHSGVAMGIVDMNGDKLDDVVRLDNTNDLYIEYQVPGQGFTEFNYGPVGSGNEWSMCVADFDRNGYNDIFVGDYNRSELLTANGTGDNYTQATIGTNIFVQGSNFMDVNHDGHLDIFACHDNSMSHIYVGDGTGNFPEGYAGVDMSTVPASDNSGNYACIWTDYDNDGDVDFYISKCRQGVTDPNDGRRINQLFQNDGTGNYTEVGQAANLRDGGQSWLTDFQDIDNDGDLDALIINHDIPSRLLVNNGDGTFTEITNGSGLDGTLNLTGIQAFFRDFDNDGWMDVFVTGDQHRLFWNDGGGSNTFTLDASNPFGNDQIESCAIGDINDDGFLDIYAGYANIFNSPSNIDDALWTNNGNNNGYISFYLEGTLSNINGLGARVNLYANGNGWSKQIREVRSGEGYGVMNSFKQHFGLGTTTMVDSVVITWPSGTIDKLVNPNINQCIAVVEGSTGVGINTPEAPSAHVSVFPNPFKDNVTVQITNYDFTNNNDLQLNIYSIDGRLVHLIPAINSPVININNMALAPGLYTYELRSNTEVLFKSKMIRE